jgi:ClpP class serine protease
MASEANSTRVNSTLADSFPRALDLPTQSPIFWVEQKDRYLRQLLIRDIEALTKRRLVIYFGNRYENAMIDARDIAFMYELLGDIGEEPFDLLIELTGGFTDPTESLISYLENLSKDFRVIVANAAKSNGTLLALSAKSVVMGAPSELGPIEPALQNIPATILAENELKALNFVLHKQGIFALKQSQILAEKLLTNGMMKGRPQQDIKDTVQKLSSRDCYLSHGSVIDHREAKSLGLNIEYLPPDDPVWQRIWLLYCMYDFDSRRSRYLKIFEGRARSTAVAAPPAPQSPKTP